MNRSYDRHLNVFWQYNGNPHLEDNITKAFINTLSLANKSLQQEVVNFFLKDIDEEITFDDYRVTFDLQNPYIQNIPELNCKKLLIGLNPSGLEWGEDIHQIIKDIDLKNDIDKKIIENDNKFKKFLESNGVLESEIEKKIDYFKYVFKTILNRGDSRPDGWIFISKNKNLNPDFVIALESKLGDLDPYQIKNHLDKSLGIKENGRKRTKNIKFENLCEVIKCNKNRKNNGLEEHFLDYMELLGHYTKVNSFSKEDVIFAQQNNFKNVLRNKWGKLFENYSKSKEFEDLKKEIGTNIYINLKTRRILFDNLSNGNIYFDIPLNKDDLGKENALFIGTEIGVNNKNFILYIQEVLKKEPNLINELAKLYSYEGKNFYSIFSIFKRLNSNSMSKFMGIKDYSVLNDCLNYFIKEEVYKNKINKENCIKILENIQNSITDYNIDSLIKNVKKWKFGEKSSSEYNLLSYLRFVDYINYSNFYEKNSFEFNYLFTEMILRHYKGLKFINNL